MHSKVSELIRKITWLTNDASFPQVSKLEIDLLMQHVRDLYEELDSLRNSSREEKHTDNVSRLVKTESATSEKIKPANENILSEVVPVKKENIAPKAEPVAGKAEVKQSATAKSSLNEIVESSESLNSKLKSSSKEIHHKLSTKPLKELIDLNKRFVIINELFGGSAEVFSKAIHQIDSSDDFAAAESFIHSQPARQYQWIESSPTVRLFWELVRQKFGVVHM